jgi:hypothetical protein
LLWNLDDCPGIGKLSKRWNDIISWERSTRKKQVRNDAKLVLATRLCLEQGKIRKNNTSSTSKKLSPQECLELLEPLQIWSVLILAEYFRCLLITHSVACYIHLLLCPTECGFDSTSRNRSGDLPEQLAITTLIRNKKDSSGLAKRLLGHCHKYQISRKIPNRYVPESESDSELSLLDDDDEDSQDLDHLLEDQLKPSTSPHQPDQRQQPSSGFHLKPSSESQNESRVSNISLSISDVRSPPKPLPLEDHPYRSREYLPSQSEYEPTTPDQTNSSVRNGARRNAKQRSQSFDLSSARKKNSNPSTWSPVDRHSSSKVSPRAAGLVTPRTSNSKSLSPGSDDPSLFSETAYQTPIAAFGRSARSSHSKTSISRSSSPTDDYLLSSSTLRSLDKQSLGSSFDSGSA